ncbi:hypothetical protein [Hydrogenimonas sp.]
MRSTISNFTSSFDTMKSVLEPLQEEDLIFKRFEPFFLGLIGSRKRIRVYHGVDLKSRYLLVFAVDRKSALLKKDIYEWLELKARIESHFGYKILQNIALLRAPLCSSAKTLLKQQGWKVVFA